MAKKQKIVVEGSRVTVQYPTLGKELTQDVAKLSKEVKFAAMLHGFKQCYGDSASGGSPQEKFEMCNRRMEAHRNGSWDLDSREQDLTIVVEALSRVLGQTVAKVEEELERKYPDEERYDERLKELRILPKVKAEIAQIRAERAAAAAADVPAEDVVIL
jgi:hypothetical protein